jgi:hypothetical protein
VEKAGRPIKRVTVAFEAGRDGFWLARRLRAHNIEAYAIHQFSIPVSREHRRAKTDRQDTELLERAFFGWLRGEPEHCSMAAIPTPDEDDAKRRVESGKISPASAHASSIGSKPLWCVWVFATSIRKFAMHRNAWTHCAHLKARRYHRTCWLNYVTIWSA